MDYKQNKKEREEKIHAKFEKCKELLFNDEHSLEFKLSLLQDNFDRMEDIKPRCYIEDRPPCDECGYDYDGVCDLEECCYLEGSSEYHKRWYTKGERDEDEDDSNDDW